jgi:proteic killer suppression protein
MWRERAIRLPEALLKALLDHMKAKEPRNNSTRTPLQALACAVGDPPVWPGCWPPLAGPESMPGDIQDRALRKLRQLDAALTIEALRNPPSTAWSPSRAAGRGKRSIRINDQWRLCFQWADGGASEVEIVDYH